MTSLSGGNQQKVALGKVLETEPRVLLCDEPTQGVDVRSRLEIYRMLRDSAEAGLAVAIVSSDAAELAGLCDRVIVLSRGQMVAELTSERGLRGEHRPHLHRARVRPRGRRREDGGEGDGAPSPSRRGCGRRSIVTRTWPDCRCWR